MRRLFFALAVLTALPGLAQARERMFTYDADSDRAKALTGAGVTLTVQQGLIGDPHLELLRATAVPVAVKVQPVAGKDEKGLREQLPPEAQRVPIYEVIRSVQQGEVLSRAFCPGASRVWVAMTAPGYGEPLTVWALGDGGVIGKTLRLCDTMGFTWKGEWTTAPTRAPPERRPLDSGRPGA